MAVGLCHHPRRGLELFDHEIGAYQRRISLDPHRHAIARLDPGDMFALLVHQEIGDGNRCLEQHLFAALARALFFQLAQDHQRQTVIRPDQPGAVAMVAGRG